MPSAESVASSSKLPAHILATPSEEASELLVSWVKKLDLNRQTNRDSIFRAAAGHPYLNNKDYPALGFGFSVCASIHFFVLPLIPGALPFSALQLLLVGPAAAGAVPALRGASESWRSARLDGASRFKAFKTLVARARAGLAVYSVPNPLLGSIFITAVSNASAVKIDGAIAARWPGSMAHKASHALNLGTARLAHTALEAHGRFADWRCGQALRATLLDGRPVAALRCYEQTALVYVDILKDDNLRHYAPDVSEKSAQTARKMLGPRAVLFRDITGLAAAAALSDALGVDPAYRPEPGLPRLGDMAAAVGRLAAQHFDPKRSQVCSVMNRWTTELEALDLNTHLGTGAVRISPPRVRL